MIFLILSASLFTVIVGLILPGPCEIKHPIVYKQDNFKGNVIAMIPLQDASIRSSTFSKFSLDYLDCYTLNLYLNIISLFNAHDKGIDRFSYTMISIGNEWIKVKGQIKNDTIIDNDEIYEKMWISSEWPFTILWWCFQSNNQTYHDEALILSIGEHYSENGKLLDIKALVKRGKKELAKYFNETLVKKTAFANNKNSKCPKPPNKYIAMVPVCVVALGAGISFFSITFLFVKRYNRVYPSI